MSTRSIFDPSDFADWDEGTLSTNKAYQKVKAAKEQAERERKLAEQERDNAMQELAKGTQHGTPIRAPKGNQNKAL